MPPGFSVAKTPSPLLSDHERYPQTADLPLPTNPGTTNNPSLLLVQTDGKRTTSTLPVYPLAPLGMYVASTCHRCLHLSFNIAYTAVSLFQWADTTTLTILAVSVLAEKYIVTT